MCAERTEMRARAAAVGGVALAVTAVVAAVAVGTALAAGARGIDGTLTRLAADDPAVVLAGGTVYAAHCASCHGADLEGQPDWRRRDANGLLPAPPHDASGHTWHHADDLLFEIVKYGPARVVGDPDYRSAMPAYEGVLDDDEIVAALSYIASRWPPEERDWQREVDRASLDSVGERRHDESLLDRLLK